jgi:hypothetical protein
MNQASVYAPLAVASSTRLSAQSAVFTTEKNSPGPAAPFNGEASSHPGDALVVGLLLISLFAAALLTPLEELIPPERSGKKSKPSTKSDSANRTETGGTAKEHYEE